MHGGDVDIQKRMGFRIQITSYIINSKIGDIVVPLTADVTTTDNIPDNKMYVPLLTSSSSSSCSCSSSSSSSSVFPLSSLRYIVVVTDLGYDAQELYESIAKD
jgi:hypothetical protein